MSLVPITHCPVCCSADRLPASDGIASRRKDTGRHYLVHAAERLGVTIDQALEAIRVYQCSRCRSYYCDPWLSPQIAAYIFTEGAPDHIAGWANFEHWLGSPQPNSVEAANNQLYRKLLKKIGPITSYAEYACPFQGFLLLFGRLETTPAMRVSAFSRAIHRRSDIRWTIGPRLHHAAQKLAHWATIIYHQLRVMKHGQILPFESVVELPTTRRLLTQGSAKAWGSNCVRYGASCSYFASKLLGADVQPFDENLRHVDKCPDQAVDLLGIFDILDHTEDPMSVIINAMKIARHVVIVTHHAEVAGKQHLFAFHESFSSWLESTLNSARVTDLTPEMLASGHRDYIYLLISRA